MKEVIHTSNAPAAIGPYSQAKMVGNFIFASGQIPFDPATGEVSPYGMNDSTALFQAAGNVFISYLDNQK